MGYTTPGKFSLGVDTSAASLKKDVKKNLAKKGGLGVDTSIKHDTSKSAAAVKKAINAPTSKAGGPSWPKGDGSDVGTGSPSNVGRPSGNTENVGPLMPPNTSGSEAFDKFKWATDRFAGTNTRQNGDMKSNIANWEGSKLKNTSRGHYTGDRTATTSGGSLKIGGKLNPVTTTETYGNVTKPGGGTGFIPKGQGSTVNSYSVDIEDKAPEGYGEKTIEAGDYQGYVAPEKTRKQKRQANRKERKEERYQKQSKKSMDIALKRQAKQENKKKKKTKTGNGDIVWKDEYRYDQDVKAAKQENK